MKRTAQRETQKRLKIYCQEWNKPLKFTFLMKDNKFVSLQPFKRHSKTTKSLCNEKNSDNSALEKFLKFLFASIVWAFVLEKQDTHKQKPAGVKKIEIGEDSKDEK